MNEAFVSTLIMMAEIGLGLTIVAFVVLGVIILRRRRRAAHIEELAALANDRVGNHRDELQRKLQGNWDHDPDELTRRVSHIAQLQADLYNTVLGMLRDQHEKTPKQLSQAAEGLVEAGQELIPSTAGKKGIPNSLRTQILGIAKQNRDLMATVAKRDEALEGLRHELATRETHEAEPSTQDHSSRYQAEEAQPDPDVQRLRSALAAQKEKEEKLQGKLDETEKALHQTQQELDRVTDEYMKLYAKLEQQAG